MVFASRNVALLRVDYDVVGFLVYLVCDAANIGTLAIMVIELSCIPLIVYDVVSSPTFRSVDCRPPIDVRPGWLSVVVAMCRSPLLLSASMSWIAWSPWMLWHRTQLASIRLHQAGYGLWIIDDEIIDVVVVRYVRDVLSLVWSWRTSCVYLRVSLIHI